MVLCWLLNLVIPTTLFAFGSRMERLRYICLTDTVPQHSFSTAGRFVWIDWREMVICLTELQIQTICQNIHSPIVTLSLANNHSSQVSAYATISQQAAMILNSLDTFTVCFILYKHMVLFILPIHRTQVLKWIVTFWLKVIREDWHHFYVCALTSV